MQFSKIWGEGNNLKNPKNNQNKKISKALAFSLIKLSIVLIIIGLLVAGITGGASLIDSARTRAAVNEINSYRAAIYTFQTARGRLPGDLNNDGIIGGCTGFGCSVYAEPTYTNFGDEYDGVRVAYKSDPLVDLYLEGITDFKPDPDGNLAESGWHCDAVGVAYPKFKNLPNNCIKIFETIINDSNSDRKNGIYLDVLYNKEGDPKIPPKLIWRIDQKIDDGLKTAGEMRADCGRGEYENCHYCNEFGYRLIGI